MCSSQRTTAAAGRSPPGTPSDTEGKGQAPPSAVDNTLIPPPLSPEHSHQVTAEQVSPLTSRSEEECDGIGLDMGTSDDNNSVNVRPSHSRSRAKLIVDGAYLEASIRAAGEGRKGRLDHQVLLTLVEDRLNVTFEKKVLYQATHDGQPNYFHRSISHPDGAHVKVVLQPLKPRVVAMETANGLRQQQEILLDKGVDLAIALEILADRSEPTPNSPAVPSLVVVTGDGDLHPVIERAERWGHDVVVCGGRKTLSERLHQYVRKGSGQAVWLDDLIEQAWVTPRATASSSSAAPTAQPSPVGLSIGVPPVVMSNAPRGPMMGGHDAMSLMKQHAHHGPGGLGPMMPSTPAASVMASLHHMSLGMGSPGGPLGVGKQKLYRCPQGRFCDKVDEPGHLRALRHPCPKGPACRYAAGHGNDAERRDHMLTFVHICPKGTSCPRNDIEHCTHFDHPYRRTKARCPDGANCPFITRGGASSNSSAREHSRMYRHPCPKGSTCPLLAGKQPSEKKRYHLMDYTHPCHVGCKYSVDKEWAWQHFSDFDHVEDHVAPTDSQSATTTEDEDNDHVILEGGWNYLDEFAGAASHAGAAWVPNPLTSLDTGATSGPASTTSSSSTSPGGTGNIPPTPGSIPSLFSQDFFKFPPGLLAENTPGLAGASGAGSAASPIHMHHHHHHPHAHPHAHPSHMDKGMASPWRQS